MMNYLDINNIKKQLKMLYPKYSVKQVAMSTDNIVVQRGSWWDKIKGKTKDVEIEFEPGLIYGSLGRGWEVEIWVAVDDVKKTVYWNFQ